MMSSISLLDSSHHLIHKLYRKCLPSNSNAKLNMHSTAKSGMRMKMALLKSHATAKCCAPSFAKVLLPVKTHPLQTLVYVGKSNAQGETTLFTTLYADPDSRLWCAVRLQVPRIRSLMLLLKNRAIKLPQWDIWRALLISPDEAMMLTLLERINPDHGTTFIVFR